MSSVAQVISKWRWTAVALVSLLALIGLAPAKAAERCEALGGGARMGDAVIVMAQPVMAGDYTASDGVRLTALPAFCRIFAVASPTPASQILIELWMPQSETWNGKFLGVGNGGHAGKIGSSILAEGLKRGYAVATTDMGSAPAAVTGVEFNFGNGRPEQIRDFGMRSTHAMTLLSKALVVRYYGKGATRAYFVGCSTGGNQALSEAQKFPDDYDGIIAGAPAHNRTHQHIHYSALRQIGTQPGAVIPMPLMAAWQKAIIKACAGLDGGAPGDRFLTNPLACTLSPRALACARVQDKDQCLSEAQIIALEEVYDGMANPRTGERYYFPDVRGAEELIFPLYDASLLPASGFDITHWVLPPERPSASFDFDHDLDGLDAAWAPTLNAMDPDLTRFATRGGKLILYHGWADGIITPVGTVDYYQQLHAKGLAKESFARLFMVAGLGHCASGPGANDIGQMMDQKPGVALSPRNDLLTALETWVEAGAAPNEMLAAKTPQPYSFPTFAVEGATPQARPVCAFPAAPRYDGKGDPLKAESFKCVRASPPDYPRPAARYLR
jgi:feruloyl esterase